MRKRHFYALIAVYCVALMTLCATAFAILGLGGTSGDTDSEYSAPLARIVTFEFTSHSISEKQLSKIAKRINAIFTARYGSDIKLMDRKTRDYIFRNVDVFDVDLATDSARRVKLGFMLNVDYIIYGTVESAGRVIEAECVLYDVEKDDATVIVNLIDYEFKGIVLQIPSAVFKFAQEILNTEVEHIISLRPKIHYVTEGEWNSLNEAIGEIRKDLAAKTELSKKADAQIVNLLGASHVQEGKMSALQKTVDRQKTNVEAMTREISGIQSENKGFTNQADSLLRSLDEQSKLLESISDMISSDEESTITTPIVRIISDMEAIERKKAQALQTPSDVVEEPPVMESVEQPDETEKEESPVNVRPTPTPTPAINADASEPAKSEEVKPAEAPDTSQGDSEASIVAESAPVDPKEKSRNLFNEVLILPISSWSSQEALLKMRETVQLDPTNATYRGALGRVHFAREEYENAMTQCLEALALSPEYPFVHTLLGSVYYELGEHHKAIEEHRIALKSDPQNFRAQYNLSYALIKTDVDAARTEFGKFIQIAKNDPSQKQWVGEAEKILKRLRAQNN